MNHKDMIKFQKSRIDSATALAKLRGIPVPTFDHAAPMWTGPYGKVIHDGNAAIRSVFGQSGMSRDSDRRPPDAATALRNAGFRLLGYGHFSIATSHPDLPGKCIKFSIRKEDSGAAFAAYCRANPKDIHLPRIEHIQNMSNCVAIVMPQYVPFRTDYEAMDGDYLDVFSVLTWKNEDWCKRKRVDTESTQYKSATAIRKFFDGLAQFDLHSSNVMRDDKGTLIIIDPVSFKQQ